MGKKLAHGAREDIIEILNDLDKDIDKFEGKGQKTAGVRLRGKFMDIIKICKNARDEILAKNKS